MRLLYISIAFVALLPATVSAETAVRVAETVTISTDQRVERDFYAAASTVTHTGSIGGDFLAAGGSVTVKGPVEADVAAIAGRVDIDAPVADDVRIVAGEAVVSGAIEGDLFVLAGMLTVLPTAAVVGDVYFFGGEGEISGPVAGSIYGRSERLRVDTTVGGSMDVTVRQGVVLGARAEIDGDVRHQGTQTVVRAPEAIVRGDITEQTTPRIDNSSALSNRVLPFLVMLFGSLVLYLVGRSFMSIVVSQALSQPLRAGLIGTSVYIVGPIVAIVLCVSVLGLVVGLGTLGAYIVLVALSYSVAPMVLGVQMWRWFGGKSVLQPFAILLGVATLQLCLLIPFVGTVLAIVFSVMAAGALAEVLFRRLIHRR